MSIEPTLTQLPVQVVQDLVCPLTKKTFRSLIDKSLFHQVPRPYVLAMIVKKDGQPLIVDGVALQTSNRTYEKVHYYAVGDKELGIFSLGIVNQKTPPFEKALILASSCNKSEEVSEARRFLLLSKGILPDLALHICAWTLADEPCNTAVLAKAGDIMRSKGDLVKAEKLFKIALKLNQACAFCWASLGCLYKIKGQLGKAYGLFSKALQIEPENQEIQTLFENFLQQDAALVGLRAHLGLCTDLLPISTGLGEICKQIGRFQESVEHFHIAQMIAPENGAVLAFLANSLRHVMINEGVTEKKLNQAQMYFEKAIVCGFDNSFARSRLADIYRVQKKDNEAIFHCRAALELNPRDAFAQMLLGKLAMNMMQFGLAEACFRNLIALKPGWTVGYEMLGDFHTYEKARSEDAERLYKKALALDPNNKSALKKLQKVIREKIDENAVEQFLA